MQGEHEKAALRINELEAQNGLLQRRAQELQEQAAAAQKDGWQAARAAEDQTAQVRRAEAEKTELQQRISLLQLQLSERCGPVCPPRKSRAFCEQLVPRPVGLTSYIRCAMSMAVRHLTHGSSVWATVSVTTRETN